MAKDGEGSTPTMEQKPPQSGGYTRQGGMWIKPSGPQLPAAPNTDPNQRSIPFDVHPSDQARFTYVDTARNSSLSNDTTPQSRHSSTSIQPLSSVSSPNIATPESIRNFDPQKFFEGMAMDGVTGGMNMSGDMGDDGGVEFFTEMLGVLNNNGN
jgi:hypothetical protein